MVGGTALWINRGSWKGPPQTPAKGDTPVSGVYRCTDRVRVSIYFPDLILELEAGESVGFLHNVSVVLQKPLEAFLIVPIPGTTREPHIPVHVAGPASANQPTS